MNQNNSLKTQKILFISNGHGEDLNSSLISEQLRNIIPDLTIEAFPIVGQGKSYVNKNIKIVAPLQEMPSGGIFYLNPLNFFKDLTSGLLTLTIRQLITMNKIKNDYDLIVAVGDVVPLFFAYLTGKKFVSFLVSTSSYYEGKLTLPFLSKFFLKSSLCQLIFARDKFTYDELKQQGFKTVIYEGYPVMDALYPSGKNLELNPENPMVALLPGSRLPEALRNFALELKVCEKLVIKYGEKWQFRGALVSSITEENLAELALENQWQYGEGIFRKEIEGKILEVKVYRDAFADILIHCNIVIGMAGTAVEQAVGLGKPVVQIPSQGPQFTYRFAEAQMRLLGLNVVTVADSQDIERKCEEGADKVQELLQNHQFLEKCVINGKERIGSQGASLKMAHQIVKLWINQ